MRIGMPPLGPLARPLRAIRRQLPPWNFITIHYFYFTVTCLVSGIILWGSATPFRSLSFVDSLFLAVSAMTLAGLNTVNLSTLNTFQQFVLFILIILGSAIFVSAFVVHVRRKAFEGKFRDVIERRRNRKSRSRSRSRSRGRTWSFRRKSVDGNAPENQAEGASNETPDSSNSAKSNENPADRSRSETPPARRGEPEMNGISGATGERLNGYNSDSDGGHPLSPTESANPGIKFRGDTRFGPNGRSVSPETSRRPRRGLFSMQGVGARPESSLHPRINSMSIERPRIDEEGKEEPAPKSNPLHIDWALGTKRGWSARNSQFHGLSLAEREKLGGCEYRAVEFLSWLVPIYFVAWQVLGCIGCGAWIAYNRPHTATANGLNPWWVGAFNAVSAFNNSGMSLLDANMTAFQTAYYILITMSLLILAGNTCYPIFLRLIVWSMWKIIRKYQGPKWEERTRTLRFLLDHPRRCYTNLFPSQHTWWLLTAVIVLNGVDWAAFEILNINNKTLEAALPTHIRVIDGLFQAFAVRSGGFYVVAIPTLRISLLVLYVVMMYISVYPVVITMRNSNVYEERSLGIYSEENSDPNDPSTQQPAPEAEKPDHPILRRAKTLLSATHGGGLANTSNGANNTLSANSHFVGQQLRAQLAHDAWLMALALFLIMIIESGQFDRNPSVFSVFNFLFEIVSAYGCVGISVGVPWAAYSFCGSWHALSKLILCVVMLRGRHRGLPVAIDKAVLLPGEATAEAEEEDGRIRLARTLTRGTAAREGV